MLRNIFFLLVAIFIGCAPAGAAVSVTAGTGGTGICSNRAITGSAPAVTALGPIVITEGINSDFSIGTAVIVLYPPSGWSFGSTLPTLTYITGSNITGISGTVTSTALTINVTVVNNTGADQITITGLQVQPNTTTAGSGNILASSTSGVAGISTGSGGTNFASLSVTAPVNATVSIAASPSGSFCPGTNVVYTPTSTNGGSPTYTWALNGTDVSIGTTYSNSSLSSGNTVSCRMLSSLGCLNANPVQSNTITATVLSAPAAITGSNIVCPGTTTALSTTATGGAWSSTNAAVGTISTTGVVTGIAAGTTTVSYTASGCAAKMTVFVNNPPFAPVLTPTVTTMCNGTSQAITATGTPASSTILAQNFNAGLSSWSVDTIGSIAILPGAEWKACADSYLNEQGWYRSPDYSTFVMANADTSGSSSTLSTRLISPSFSLAEYSAATLSFQHAYDYWPAGDVFVNLEISTNGGSSWTTIANFTGATIGGKMAFVTQTFSLNSYLGHANVKIRFYYKSTFGYYWAIDNVLITGTPAVITPTWSPVTHLFTNSGLTTPYTAGTQANTVYVYPTSVSTPVTVVYTATATSVAGGCTAVSTSTVTINPVPGTTSGGLNVCVGTSSTLSNSASGGTWLSANPSVVTVGSSTGIVTGVAVGTATISYISGASCATLSVVTVNTTPAPISGVFNVCLGYPGTLTSATTGGTWSSSNTSVATVGYSTGVVTGVSLGTSRITYSLGAGCTVTAVITVQPLPAAVTGPMVVCAGQSVTLANASVGGVWLSGATGTATAGYTTGLVTGVAGGTVNISYVLPATGCFSIANVTVNPLGPIAGSGNACIGYATVLSNSATGGTWASSTPAVGTIDATSGGLTGISTGTTNVTYTLSTGCVAYRVITVNALPADIAGAANVCAGGSITLTNSTTGGTWSSSHPAMASVGLTTGIVSGGTAGTAVITYTAATSCIKTFTVTVNPPPAAITGSASLCTGFTTTLSNASGSGTWSSSNTAVATVNSSGGVTGESTGTAVITFTLPSGCFGTRNVTVNPLPAAITGTAQVCQGLTTTLSSASTGGTWSSSNVVVAVVPASATGSILGGASGTAVVTYTLPTGCITTAIFTVNSLPGAISGASTVCTGVSVALSTASTGGGWISSSSSTATVGSAGVVTGISAGNPTITYMLPTGCIATKAMTVYASPATITGTASVCQDLSTTFSTSTTGGVWSSSNTAVASIVSATGVATGIAPGTAVITYMVSSGCVATVTATVMPLPATITGNLNLCLGNSSALENATTGGTWSSSATGVATIGASTGIAFGAGLGMANITYTLPTGCYNTAIAVVNPLPAAITGASAICVGSSIVLTNATSGGTWSSSDNTIANASSGGGVVFGEAAGTATVSYTLPTGCPATRIITVNPLPASIAGPNNICQAAYVSMTSITGGGTWSSSTVSVGTIGASSGILYGVAGGGAIITYTLPTGCFTVKAVTVTGLPAAISGASTVCVGSVMLLSNSTSGGSWISGNPGVAAISPAGLVSGIAAGTTIMTYMLPLGCMATRTVTVNPLPAAITGPATLCLGVPMTMSNATPGGGWSSSNAVVATIHSSTGIVTGSIYGTAIISYTLLTGCNTTTVVSVVLTPSAIAGANTVCAGANTLFTNVVNGGTWSSSNTSIATVPASAGLIAGVSAGTATITYTLSTGCYVTKSITVNPLPAGITGPPAICQGLSATLSSATTGGTWTSGSTSVASVGFATGTVNGMSPGTTNITYTLSTGCATSTVLTVHALPAPLTGSANVCLGGTTTLSTATGGGTWTSGTISVASVDAGGVVTGVSTGTSVITYILGLGCSISRTVTVNPLPPAITGSTPTCVGINITLSNPTAGGTWSSTTTPGIATVNAVTGVVSPVSAGTGIITYSLGTGCYTTTTVLINTVAPISGNTALCVGSVSMLSHSTTGGTWTSSNTAVVGVSLTSGIAVAYSANTAVISYTMPGGCVAIKVATVSALPTAVSGPSIVCPGFSVTLGNATTGGLWTSLNTSVATIGSSTGVVTGVAPGTTTISYTMPGGCGVAKIITVNVLPGAISGSTDICVGATSALSSSTAGGTWSSTTPSVATIGATTGLLSGVGAGTSIITYAPASGCITIAIVTVNNNPTTIVGAASVCEGSTTTLTNTVSGGTWISSNTAVATVGAATGVVSGLMQGTATISYTLGIGCAASVVVTVNTMPTAIAGAASACVGFTTSLGSTPAGGTWSTSNAPVATVSAAGLVSGVSAGTAIISYGFPSGCRVQVVVTVSPGGSVIAGNVPFCVGADITLSDPASGGGTWSSSNTAIASIGSLSGVVTGGAAGTAVIAYNIGSGCSTSAIVTVNPVPAGITGIPSACIGLSTNLSCATPGGAWSSSSSAIALVGAGTGVVSGMMAGAAFISYTIPNGCYALQHVTVNPLPGTMTGITNMCAGASTTLANSTPGGIWSAGTPGVATADAATGTVTGVSGGTSTITYLLGSGCMALTIVTVDPAPLPITGSTNLCQGLTTNLTSASSGGVWSVSNPSVASIVTGSGDVTAITTGTAIITYTIGTGCKTTAGITVNPFAPTTGGANTCVGFSTTLANPVPGGIWSSGSPTVAGVSAGVVSGFSAGTAAISYSLPSGCMSVTVVTINALSPITGSANVCAGQTTSLGNAAGGGTWSSNNLPVATVNSSTGVVSGVLPGTATISYNFGGGCVAVRVISVNALTVITGAGSICAGQTSPLANSIAGGTWSSGAPAIATVDAAGVVIGLVPGTATISYQLSTGCVATKVVTVNPISAIAGPGNVCSGSAIVLSNATPGGTWSSSNTGVATAVALTGSITGIGAGTSTISYIMGTGCYATTTVTVSPTPAPISGASNICLLATATYSNTTPGGAWASSDGSIATIAASGTATAVAPGAVVISYTLSTGCFATKPVTVSALPAAITGALQVCEGSVTTLANSVPGGTWGSGNTAVAIANATTGAVTGVTQGTATISYTLGTGCTEVAVVTVDPLPGAITGAGNVCVGATTVLSSMTVGGFWSSPYANIGVGMTTGAVNGLSAGAAIVTYTLPTGCFRSYPVVVNPLPAAIAGITQVCTGLTTVLNNSSPGGTWVSAATSVADVDVTSGVVTGISSGTSTISYIIGTGCFATVVVTVDPLPAAITGVAVVCQGASTMLSAFTAGGVWSSGASAIAAVGPAGLVTGVAAGVANITYTMPTGCISTKQVTVNPLPAPISGAGNVCMGQTISLTNASPGGLWISDATTVATIDASTGVVAGINVGTSTISYSLITGCIRTAVVSVNLSPMAISGSAQVCTGTSVSLANATAGGVWSSGTPAIASVSATGVVNGMHVGTTSISYTLSTGCRAVQVVTVNPVPPPVTGAANMCPGGSITLYNTMAGGSWSSAATSIVSVDAGSGVISGLAPGLAVITYTMPTGCRTNAVISVYPPPSPITGVATACQGATSTLFNATAGGTWISSSPGIVAVSSSTGVVSALSFGTAVLSYVLPTGCAATRVFTVNPLPPAIAGAMSACLSTTTILTNSVPGGIWTSGDVSVVTIDAITGITTGTSLGTASITYTLPTGCRTSAVISVYPPPSAITGTTHICQGATALLSSSTAGGVWSSSNPLVATMSSGAGVLTSTGAGLTTIAYTLTTGCSAYVVVTVDPLLPITGSNTVCTGDTVVYSNGVPGGVWSSSTVGVATVSASGAVYGVAPGIAVISYSLSSGCLATQTLTVNQLPVSFLVTGGGSFCTGSTGVPVGLNGSISGFGYHLYNGVTPVGYVAGTGSAINYGLQTAGGTYTVRAVNLLTGCARMMLSSAVVSPVAYGPAGVSIATVTGDTVCNGTSVVFSPVTYLAGSMPVFQWRVNGVVVSGASSYTYAPANGDIVTCNLTSNAVCAVPNTASASINMTVLPMVEPLVNVSASPGNLVCKLTPVSFTAMPVYGGTSPVFSWYRNGVAVAGGGAVYSYTPTDGDIIRCDMASNARCRTVDVVNSDPISMTVVEYSTPAVTINATPGFHISAGQEVTFAAVAVNAGIAPAYQWKINGTPIGGATNASFVWSSFVQHDTISCMVTSSGLCGGITTTVWEVIELQGVGIAGPRNSAGRIVLLPNPNKGEFTIRGRMVTDNGPVVLQVTDMLGQVVFEQVAKIIKGAIDEKVLTGNKLANGMYLLSVHSAGDNFTLPFVLRR